MPVFNTAVLLLSVSAVLSATAHSPASRPVKESCAVLEVGERTVSPLPGTKSSQLPAWLIEGLKCYIVMTECMRICASQAATLAIFHGPAIADEFYSICVSRCPPCSRRQ